uniref:Ribosomal RNA-processing protein 12 n=1 Tax=Kwoniella bestiolae CBS 10118 TaxID=1296100 RepID=A0A1B9FZB6_9TREE|nr:ribosomal RNA-processing protein 12 [Kwoniella bestiolae CBS 10118]OCF24112.1 ribosomal RNA-processing protein 12 [Kwoniella bestiolae CBS 10118]
MASSSEPQSFATALANVRRLTSSALPHQSKPAQLLVAIESTISSTLGSSDLPHSSTAYFASLQQVLEKAVNDEVPTGTVGDEEMAESENMGSGALLPAILYLLAIVIPETPNQVVISKCTNILENVLPLFDTSLEHPPALRSLIQITTSLLLVAPPALLNSSPLLKKAWNYLLELNLDPRPKVRHLAQEGIRKILVTPIPPRLTPGSHPYLPRAREWTVSILQEEVKSSGGGGRGDTKKARFADGEDQEGKRAIWVIQGLRGWVPVWGDEQLSSLCGLLLSLPPLPHLTPQIYSLLAHLLSPPPAEAAGPVPSVLTNLPTILDSLLASPPGLSETPTYLSAITSALIKMSLQDPLSLSTYLPKAFNLIFHNILLSPNTPPSVCTSAAEAVGSQGILRYCITDEAILHTLTYVRSGSHVPGARKKQKTPFLYRLISSLTESMNTHALKLPYLFSILTALISRLRLRVLLPSGNVEAKVDESGQGQTAAQELLMDLIKDVGDLRHQKGFEGKDGVDRVLGMAIEVIGVKVVLDRLPLNIEPDASGAPQYPGRAYLLPLIRERTTNDELSFFTAYFRPLSERLFEKKVSAEDGGRAAEAKVWETLVSQIWDCWSGFCEMPRDLREGLDTPFLSLLTSLLYTQPTLLSSLLRGLSQLVSSTQRLANSSSPPEELRKQFGLDQSSAKANLDYLKTLAKDMVSVLLNVFSKLPRESRGMVGEVIGLWVGIMTEKDIIETYNTVTTHLSTNLHTTVPPSAGASPISHTMLDLLIIFVPHLPPTQSQALFNAASQGTMLEHHDATVQKKSYRLLKRLLEAGKLDKARNVEEFVKKLSEAGGGVGPGAQRDRLQLLSALVESLPNDSLHIIPELLSEAVLGTKEVNERARDAGFDLLVVMGKKMAAGGKVKLQVEDDEESMDTVQANAEEYITMVAAGLTGTTPHMISASINALSRLLFEFKDDISSNTLSELISTLSVFLQSKNREIVKSALGFAKVSIVSLPLEVLRPHLGSLVPSLLGWVHDHKNHFKSKTVHIFERLIRRFGYDDVYNASSEMPEERKVLVGIRKRKERAKKRKGGRDEDGEGEEGEKPRQSSGNAFDDILYNSDSDLSDDNDDDEDERPQKGRKGQQQQQQQQNKRGKQASERDNRYIRNEGDEPMDLLSRGIAGGIASSDPSAQKARRKPGQDASHFTTDKSGKMVIREDQSSDEDAGPSTSSARAMEGSGFMARNEVDGFTRDSRGNMKFTRNTKKARDNELSMMIDEEGDRKLENTKKLEERRKKRKAMGLGEEFKAKRAGGDIKRTGGPDPYSYVSLGQAGSRKQGKGGQKLNLTNKKKGSRH